MKVTFEKNSHGQEVKVVWEPTGKRHNVCSAGWEEEMDGVGLDKSKWNGIAKFIKDETSNGSLSGEISDKEEIPLHI